MPGQSYDEDSTPRASQLRLLAVLTSYDTFIMPRELEMNGIDFEIEANRRHASRQKCLLRAYVYFGNSSNAVDCIVRDISESGARLKFKGSPIHTDTLTLCIPTRGQRLHAKVKWAEHDEIDVAFVGVLGSAESALADRVARLESEIEITKRLIKRLQQNAGILTEVD